MNKIILFLIIFIAPPTFAQSENQGESATPQASVTESGSAKVKVKGNKISVSFDDELIKGDNPNPEVEFIFDRAEFNYRKMIKLRDNFIPEAEVGKELFRESN